MLSPHTFLLGILFHDNVFRAPRIRSIGDLRCLFLEEILLKSEKSENYMFYKIEGIKGQIKYYRDQPISKSSPSSQFQTFGEITGFK
ncbi:hypothetical protein N7533_012893 [Penicillium manginii]|uniref:uncharacterized protein n=1 Tax=Penicillium manginii TaxID=203109 RepID=UPI002546E002|nr:uncharacterized protein N7533_012893 [Penicillium manginii]KAJ5740109.1 hypothetical protein N7533_012893 [Penicillium manginii]